MEYRWVKRIDLILGQLASFSCKSLLGPHISRQRRISLVWIETDKTAVKPVQESDQIMARTLDEIGKKCPAEGEAKAVT